LTRRFRRIRANDGSLWRTRTAWHRLRFAYVFSGEHG
jgi:hypothetical protein